MRNKILVTGASGNIGQPLIAALAGAKADFTVMRSKATDAKDSFETRIASFDDVAALTQAFAGIDTLFLLFPLVENKLTLAKNAVAAAQAAGVKHIVRSSGAGADPNSAFSLSKLQGEIDAVISASGIPSTFLRPGSFMQNYATYQSQAIQAGTIYMADGGQAQALIDTRDIADVAAAILRNPAPYTGNAYTLTGGVAFTGKEAAAIIAKALGKAVAHISISTEQAAETMRQWGMPAFTVDVLDSLNRVISAGYANGVSPEVENILGRKPRSFESFVQEQLATWRS
jgi:uncharacterized protein YbjT (DUF2867 family)